MSKVSPFHSKRPGTKVHHNDNKCTEGNNIEPKGTILNRITVQAARAGIHSAAIAKASKI